MAMEPTIGAFDREWEVHKFGGTSVASAECYLSAAAIVEDRLGIRTEGKGGNEDVESTGGGVGWADIDGDGGSSEGSGGTDGRGGRWSLGVATVVSAMGGKPKVTDLLLNVVRAASKRDPEEVDALLRQVEEKHERCIKNLPLGGCGGGTTATMNGQEKSGEGGGDLMGLIRSDIRDIRDILKTVSLMKWKAKRISELVSGYGELWSARILTALLNARAREREHRDGNGVAENGVLADHRRRRDTFAYLDARRFITIDEEAIQNGVVCWDVSEERFREAYDTEVDRAAAAAGGDLDATSLHFVITGYVASNTEGVSTTLQRDGSDYSAAIVGRLLSASQISIWTDVDGVLSADPRRVPNAFVIPEVSYNEAMELAYFGAKVIHPKTMQPAISAIPRQIPIYIRNTFNSSYPGTRIFTGSTTTTSRDRCVCGFSSVEDMALINVEGTGLVGVPGVARRLFGTLEGVGVSVVLISQASSEHTITFATAMTQATAAKEAIEEEFRRELAASRITAIDVQSPCSIIAAVGDGMHTTAGVAGRFFSALGDAKINVLAISQGSAQRNISAVVWRSESTRALRAAHAAFRLSHTVVRVGVVGINEIGYSLLELLEAQRAKLREAFDIDLRVCAVAADGTSDDIVALTRKNNGEDADSITCAAFDAATGGSLPVGASDKSLERDASDDGGGAKIAATVPGGVVAMAEHVQSDEVAHAVIIDCTAEEEVGRKHPEWLRSGVHVVTANNSALSGPISLREDIRTAEVQQGKLSARYLREVTVGGGLPVISTLQNLLHSGDKIRHIDGVLSVSMSFIMHRIAPPPQSTSCVEFDEKITSGIYQKRLSMTKPSNIGEACSFSQAVREAVALGLTESDVVKDLNFEYTARCLMVLAKELGMDEDYDVNKILRGSEPIVDAGVNFDNISAELDRQMADRVANAAKRGCVPRQISSIDVKSGTIDIKIVDVPNSHIFAITSPSNECVRFFTARHRRYPLVIEGPSAGADSTSSALLAELLNLMRSKVGPRSGTLSRTASSAILS